MCVCVCVPFKYHGNERFLVRHEKQIPHSRRVIYASPLGFHLQTHTHSYGHTEVLYTHSHTVHGNTNAVFSSV